jgi:hypothetical protein
VYPLYQMLTVMDTQMDTQIALSDGRDAIPHVMKGCRGKANLKNYESPYQQ